jgi:glutamate formiminotransferase
MLVECVPNFSEGRDPRKLDLLLQAIRRVPSAHILDTHMDRDHNRSVITLAGPPEAVAEAALRATGEALALIDLNLHRGEHPRIGATDVIPFVPLEEITLAECAALARRTGEQIWARFRIPVYFYEAAALRAERRNLAVIRRGGFEVLREQVRSDPDRRPDVGDPQLHPTAGATAVGARNLLVAYNVNLASDELEIARSIARAVRASSGGLPAVKALGMLLKSRDTGGHRGQAQVSMNLTDWKQTSLKTAFEAVREQAARRSVSVESSEIVGLVPAGAFGGARPEELLLKGFEPGKILEKRLREALGRE